MKNITSLIAMAMLSTMSTCALTSCSNDETLDVTPNSIAGIWMHEDRTDNDYDYLQFNADGTGIKWEVYKNAPDGQRHDEETFKYSINGNKITFFEPDGERDVESIKMKNNNEIVIDRDTYKRQK